MVGRTKAEGIEIFDGEVKDVTIEPSQREDISGEQIHIQIEPLDKSLLKDSKTGCMHEWIRLSPKSTDTTVPEGSTADNYIQEIESVIPEAKKIELVAQVFNIIKGRKFTFVQKRLGKSFKGYEAKNYWVPKKEL